MGREEIIEERAVSLIELKDSLEKINKRDKELSFRANRVNEYLAHFTNLKLKQVNELKEKLEKLEIPRLKEKIIIKIIDILPESNDDLRVILSGEAVTINPENMEKIIKTVKEYVKKK